MNLKAFAIAFIAINIGIASGAVPAYSQLFNDPDNASAPVPVFVAPPPSITQTGYSQPGFAEIPNKPAMTERDIIEKNKLIAQQNEIRTQQGRDAANAAYAASVAAIAAKREAEEKAKRGALQNAGYKTPGAAAPIPVFDPYAGHQVIFTGNKKADDNTPVRLFNIQ